MDLKEVRGQIDRVDREIAQLFEERMKAAEAVAAYKREKGLPVEDKNREKAMIQQELEWVKPLYRPYFRSLLECMIGESKKYQGLLLRKMTVTYSGMPGAFAYIASGRIFPTAEKVSCPDFESAYRMVEQGQANAAVLPIENSFAGDVGQVMDLSYRGSLSIAGIYEMPLSQSLLGVPGTRMEDIRVVESHPQALSQSMPYLRRHGWELRQAANTAVAAKEISKMGRKEIAVVAAKEAASFYGLEVLEEEINESKTNTTRFAVFTAAPALVKKEDEQFVLMFSSKNEPGTLGEAIAIIGRRGFNLRCLKSHPTGEENWAYYFYVEGDGNLGSEAGRQMLEELKSVCSSVRLMGSFGRERVLREEPEGKE